MGGGVRVYACVCVCACVCTHVHMCLCVYVHTCVCMCLCIPQYSIFHYGHTYIHVYNLTYPYTTCSTVGRCTVYTHSCLTSLHSFGCFRPNRTLFFAGCYLWYRFLHLHSYVHIGDQTAILREGYWGSYNVPFYEDVFVMSGYAAMEKKRGPSLSHDLAPRAEIFRRDQGKVSCTEQEVGV